MAMQVARTIHLADQSGSWIEVELTDDSVKLRTKRGQQCELQSVVDVQALIGVLAEAEGSLIRSS